MELDLTNFQKRLEMSDRKSKDVLINTGIISGLVIQGLWNIYGIYLLVRWVVQ